MSAILRSLASLVCAGWGRNSTAALSICVRTAACSIQRSCAMRCQQRLACCCQLSSLTVGFHRLWDHQVCNRYLAQASCFLGHLADHLSCRFVCIQLRATCSPAWVHVWWLPEGLRFPGRACVTQLAMSLARLLELASVIYPMEIIQDSFQVPKCVTKRI